MTQVTMNSAHALAWLDCLNDVPLFEDRQSSNVLPRRMAEVRVHNSPNKPSEGDAWLNMNVLNIIWRFFHPSITKYLSWFLWFYFWLRTIYYTYCLVKRLFKGMYKTNIQDVLLATIVINNLKPKCLYALERNALCLLVNF